MKTLETALALILVTTGSALAQQAATPANAQNSARSTANTDASQVRVGEVIALSDWDTDSLYENSWSAEALFDRQVFSRNGDEIGDVEDLIIGSNGELLALVAEVGGVWDIGDTHVSVPWNQVTFRQDGTVALPVTEDNADEFSVLSMPTGQQLSEGVVSNLDDRELGPRAWRASELIGDIARIRGTGDQAGQASGQTDQTSQTGQAAASQTTGQNNATGQNRQTSAAQGAQDATANRSTQTTSTQNTMTPAMRERAAAYQGYGYVSDLIFEEGRVKAAVVERDAGYGTRGRFAYPYYGYSYGWAPGNRYYDLPYNRDEAVTLAPFDYDRLNDS